MGTNNRKKWILAIAAVLCLIVTLGVRFYNNHTKGIPVSYKEFQNRIQEQQVESIKICLEEETFSFVTKDGERYITENPKYETFKRDMLKEGISIEEISSAKSITDVIRDILMMGIDFILLFMIFSINGKDKSIAVVQPENMMRFSDIGGHKEIKEDLQTIVDFLKNPKEYEAMGARIPKGVLLYGTPGTGKTLLAKAVAGEADVNFLAVSASDMEDKFVGSGVRYLNKIFKIAQKKKPCIIFIDELDAIGKKRTSDSINPYANQTINALLNHMDGMKKQDGIFVMAATNRMEDLDPALIRPGRFDMHFAVSIPASTEERREIIEIHGKNKKFSSERELDQLCRETVGYSPAQIETIMNEAAIIAVKEHSESITWEHLSEAQAKLILKGHIKKKQILSEKEQKISAIHESGHAVVANLSGKTVIKLTIMPSTSGTGGFTLIENQGNCMIGKNDLETEIKILYAGRAAEKICLGADNITSGAADDLKKASSLIKAYIDDYGMTDEWGYINSEIFCERAELLQIARTMSVALMKETENIIRNNKETIEALGKALQEKGTLSKDEIQVLIG